MLYLDKASELHFPERESSYLIFYERAITLAQDTHDKITCHEDTSAFAEPKQS